MAELLYLGDKDAAGNRGVVRVTPPVYTKQLKPFVQIVYLATQLTFELAKYAQSLFGSKDLRFPYRVNSSLVLGEERRTILQRRLDELESRDA